MKVCSRCKKNLPDKNFRFKNKKRGTRQSLCIECNKEYQREHYLKNKDDYVKKSKAYKKKLYDKIKAIKESNPCIDCGKYYAFYQMDFDHISDNKEANISQMAYRYSSWRSIQNEISKCELVCSNCHRHRTYTRSNR